MSHPNDPDDQRPPQAPSWNQPGQQPGQQGTPSYGEPTQQIPSHDPDATRPLPGYGSPQGSSGGGYGDPAGAPQGGYGAAPQGGYGAPQEGYGAAPQGGYGAAPQGGYGGPPAGGYGGPPTGQGQQGTSGLAVAALITGVLGFLCVTAIAAIVLGIVAMGQIRRTGKKGKGLAIAGIVLGVVWLVVGALSFSSIWNNIQDAMDTASPTTTTTTSTDPQTSEPAPTSSSPSPSETETGEPEPSTAVIALGDCVDDPAIIDGSDVPQSAVVDCAEPHYAEAYAEFDLAEAPYPGEEAVTQQAEAGCDTEFTTFVGLDYQESELEVFYYYPTEDAWDFDRGVVCILLDPSGEPVTGSLQGANR